MILVWILKAKHLLISPKNILSAAYLQNREGGARARRAPLHPRRAPYSRHWRDFSEEVFVVWGRLQAGKPLEELSGGTFCRWRAPSNYIFLVKHSRLEGAEQSQRGVMAQCPPTYAPVYYCQQSSISTYFLSNCLHVYSFSLFMRAFIVTAFHFECSTKRNEFYFEQTVVV